MRILKHSKNSFLDDEPEVNYSLPKDSGVKIIYSSQPSDNNFAKVVAISESAKLTTDISAGNINHSVEIGTGQKIWHQAPRKKR